LIELNSYTPHFYVNCKDYEKAFDSVDRETLCRLLRHLGVPQKIISLIRGTYQEMSCRIVYMGKLSDTFEVKTFIIYTSGLPNRTA
jgi:hypothetical protein